MRADIASYHQGVRNANDAISMIQTADGALEIINEKLIRMKELAMQAATGTYNSTQRLMIDSEFQAMGAEIERIARATDFKGIKLLDGSLSGSHDGSGLAPIGAMKIHFGPGNDSAEDYYYVEIGDCTLAGLGLTDGIGGTTNNIQTPSFNDCPPTGQDVFMTSGYLANMQDIILQQGLWYDTARGSRDNPDLEQNFMFIIPQGTKK